MKKIELSIILPTYNESRNIKLLIPAIEALLKKRKIASEIIVVDDSSPDGTARFAEKLNKKYGNIRVLKGRKRQGLGSALKAGYDAARGEIILSMDSDLSIDPQDIHKILNKMHEGYDFVVGSRHSQGSGYDNPNLRTTIKKAISTAGNALTTALIRIPVRDYSMNFRAVRRGAWKQIKTKEKRNVFLLEMIVELHKKGFLIAEVPFQFKERKFGKSKMRLLNEVIPFLTRVLKYAAR